MLDSDAGRIAAKETDILEFPINPLLRENHQLMRYKNMRDIPFVKL